MSVTCNEHIWPPSPKDSRTRRGAGEATRDTPVQGIQAAPRWLGRYLQSGPQWSSFAATKETRLARKKLSETVKSPQYDSAPRNRESRRPTFIFVGPGRAGSSWFSEVLRDHPDIFVPPNRATFFFDQHYQMGVQWYESFFSGAKGRIAGEVCETYLASREALQRIRDYEPDMRVICCLRNPYQRAISSWRFFGRNGLGQPTLVAQAERYPAVIAAGYYATQLQLVNSLFDRRRVLTFLYEEVASDPRSVVRRLYSFIGVDPEFIPKSLNRRINANGRPRSRLLARLVNDVHAHTWGTSRIASNAVGNLKRIRPLRRLVQVALYAEERRPPDWRSLLQEFPDGVISRYEQEITRLEQMLGRDLSSWRAGDRACAVPALTSGEATDSASRSSAGSCRP